MILAKDLKRHLDRKWAERDNKIRQEVNDLWTKWNNRRVEAEKRGEPFDEPPPDINKAGSRGR